MEKYKTLVETAFHNAENNISKITNVWNKNKTFL